MTTTSPADSDTLHGVPWAECFALRDRHARYWHRRQGARYPLEEYQSAGNLAMAKAFNTFDATQHPCFTTHLRAQLRFHMLKVRHTEAGAGNIGKTKGLARYKVTTQDPDWWTQHAPAVAFADAALCALVDVQRWLPTCPRPLYAEALRLAALGYSEEEIATALQLTPSAVKQGLRRLRLRYHAWETGTYQSPDDQRDAQRAQKSSLATQAQALHATGTSQRQIAHALGIHRRSVQRYLRAA